MRKQISAGHVGALGCWTVGLVLVVLWMLFELRTSGLGLLIAGAGGVWNVRTFLGEMEERERNAFRIGRDFAEVHKMPRS